MLLHWLSSGGGGEFEIKGTSGNRSARSLVDSEIALETMYGVVRTGTVLRYTDRKLRVRLLRQSAMHLSGQIAALALLPNGGRSRPDSQASSFIMERRYILEAELRFVSQPGPYSLLSPAVIIGRTGSGLVHPGNIIIQAPERQSQILLLRGHAQDLPAPLTSLVSAYCQAVTDATLSGPNDGAGLSAAAGIVSDLMQELGNWTDAYLTGTDPLPELFKLAGLTMTGPTTGNIPSPAQIPDADLEARRRSEHILRLTKMRGASGAKFRRDVQRAYDFTCAFCGFKAPGSPGLSTAGVDAAHILPWGSFNLDVPQNGLILCKQHHWAFDNHVLVLKFASGNYFVDIGPDALELVGGHQPTLDAIAECSGQIDPIRLPAVSLRPDPAYIRALYALTS